VVSKAFVSFAFSFFLLSLFDLLASCSFFLCFLSLYRRTQKHHTDTQENSIDLYEVGYCKSLQSLYGVDESSFDIDAPENVHNGVGVGLGIINASHYNDVVANYKDFFCRR
jgi:hypothetical protein